MVHTKTAIVSFLRTSTKSNIMTNTSDATQGPVLRETSSSSLEERRNRALRRIQSYDTRPSTVAARNFLGVTDSDDNDNDTDNDTDTDSGSKKKKKANRPAFHWKTLPQRVEWLCEVLEGWVSTRCTSVCCVVNAALVSCLTVLLSYYYS
jgi:hypothetical protein